MRWFAVKGELIDDQGFVVETPNSVSSLLGTTTPVDVVNAILATIPDNANVLQMGPYTAGNANTKGVHTRKIYPMSNTNL